MPESYKIDQHKAYICIGSNLGDRRAQLKKAVEGLAAFKETAISGCSSLYETAPVGLDDNGQDFLNQAVRIETVLAPVALLELCLTLENSIGRVRGLPGSVISRVIDIDIIFYDSLVINTPKLVVPHPLMHERLFVLIPLLEIDPELVHPMFNTRLDELARRAQGPVIKPV